MSTLLVCAGYCEACITRNFSIKAWKSVSQSYARGEWSCYACQPAPLRLVPQLCLVLQHRLVPQLRLVPSRKKCALPASPSRATASSRR